MTECLIGFGSNLGDSQAIYDQAQTLLDQVPGTSLRAGSDLISTTPIGGPENQRSYSNGAIRVSTTLSAAEFHSRLAAIETELGRERKIRWAARRIDLDLLLFGQEQVRTKDLTVPHPRMSFRRFVLEPAAAIGGELLHVDSGRTIQQLLEHLNTAERCVLMIGDLSSLKMDELGASHPDWQFEQTDKVPAKPDRTYMLAVDAGSEGTSWPGPRLVLCKDQQSTWRTEIIAAMEAMMPLENIA